jgi:hypothetical protein
VAAALCGLMMRSGMTGRSMDGRAGNDGVGQNGRQQATYTCLLHCVHICDSRVDPCVVLAGLCFLSSPLSSQYCFLLGAQRVGHTAQQHTNTNGTATESHNQRATNSMHACLAQIRTRPARTAGCGVRKQGVLESGCSVFYSCFCPYIMCICVLTSCSGSFPVFDIDECRSTFT